MSIIVYILNYVLLSTECFIAVTAAFVILCALLFAKRKTMPALAKKILIGLIAVCVAYLLFIAVFTHAIPI